MTIKITKTPIPGINLSISESSKSDSIQLKAVCDPLKVFNFEQTEGGWTKHLSNQHNTEALDFPDRDHQTLRKQVGSSRFVPKFYTDESSFQEIQSSTTSTGEEKTFTRVRTRVYQSLPICFSLWFISVIIAYAPNRDVLMRNIQPGQWLPEVFIEMANKVRHSEGPTASILEASVLNVVVPESFKNTIFDKEYIITEQGFIFILDFLNYLGSSPANYANGEYYDGTKAFPVPRLYSGRTSTHTSLSVTSYSKEQLSSSFVVTSFTSYGSTIKDINVYDAIFLQAHLLNKDDTAFNSNYNEKFDVNGVSPSTYSQYIIKRVARGLRNSNATEKRARQAQSGNAQERPQKRETSPSSDSTSFVNVQQVANDYALQALNYLRDNFPQPGIFLINKLSRERNSKSIPLYIYNIA